LIVYLDTSALLKLYLAEDGSPGICESVSTAALACTHLIAYAEMRAALARAVRMGRLAEDERRRQVRALDTDWAALHTIAVDEALVQRAGEHAERFGLRGYDSVHLAAAERAFDGAGRPAAFMLTAFDGDLCDAAQALGIPVMR